MVTHLIKQNLIMNIFLYILYYQILNNVKI